MDPEQAPTERINAKIITGNVPQDVKSSNPYPVVVTIDTILKRLTLVAETKSIF